MRNKEKTETINELYGSVQDTHNYGETYYYQQAKETAAVTAIAMIRDGVPPVDIRICIDNWYSVEIPLQHLTPPHHAPSAAKRPRPS